MHHLARRWFATHTSASADWPVSPLRERKGATTVSVVLPALNEEPTVGGIVAQLAEFAATTGLVDEIIVIDSGSTDRTAETAANAGAAVHHREDILPGLGSRPGKGEALWKSLQVTRGDLIVFIDADLTDFGPHYVTGLLGPLLNSPEVLLSKGFYDRPLLTPPPLLDGRDAPAFGGGRVTELTARPLINAYYPELAGVVQPLAGEYAARRSLLETLPFAAGYGVDIGILLDTAASHGIEAISQTDLAHRTHSHQDTAALGRMAATVLHTVLRRINPGFGPWPELTQFRRPPGHSSSILARPKLSSASRPEPGNMARTEPEITAGFIAEDFAVPSEDRPPMIEVPEYWRAHARI